MDWSNIAAYAATSLALCLSPGPAVLLVVGLSMRQGFWRAEAASAGILTVNAIYFALSAAGVASLILASATLFNILKMVGALYLAYLGVRMIIPLLQAKKNGSESGLKIQQTEEKLRSASPLACYWRGASMQLSNPKNLAFFVAIVPQFIDQHGKVAVQMVALGAIDITIEFAILLLYALAFSTLAKLITQRLVLWIEAVAGGVLIALAGALAFERRT